MRARLYTSRGPSGRCLLLAKALDDNAILPPGEAINEAKRLFDQQYTRERPLLITLQEDADSGELERLCAAYGVVYEPVEEERP